MMQEIMWSVLDGPGLEHLRLTSSHSGTVADGQIITTLFDARPIRLQYMVRCDERWRVREVRVIAEHAPTAVNLRADGEGHWTTDAGDALPHLDGCIDVDIMATPFTNTLPIRRLGLRPGESAELSVAYVVVPSLEVVVSPQRYTCLESRADGGLVLDYPGIWRRVWPPKAEG